MFTVTGLHEEVPYAVTVVDGAVSGSTRIAALLDRQQGQSVRLTPTSESQAFDADTADDVAVLAALMSWTQVIAVTGEAPSDTDPSTPAGAVF